MTLMKEPQRTVGGSDVTRITSFIKVLIPLLLILGSISLYGRYDERVKEVEYKITGLTAATATVTKIDKPNRLSQTKYELTFEDDTTKKYSTDFVTYEKLLLGSQVDLYWAATTDEEGIVTMQFYFPMRKYERNVLMISSLALAVIGLTGVIIAFGIKRTAIED